MRLRLISINNGDNMRENDILNKYFGDKSQVDDLVDKFNLLDESRKSQFVAKLIGLGVLTKDKKGKLKPGKNKMSKDDVISKLRKK
jgi:hypothetical protein